jgi:hypothetical protein
MFVSHLNCSGYISVTFTAPKLEQIHQLVTTDQLDVVHYAYIFDKGLYFWCSVMAQVNKNHI